MSRVSSWETKHNTISSFFEAYPTPSHLLDADPNKVLDVIRPLGLFPTRMQSLIAISTRILEMPRFILGLDKAHKVYGIGEFGFQSYQIFCQNKGKEINPTDRALATFANWQKREAKKIASGKNDECDDEEAAEQESEAEEEEKEEKLSDRARRMAEREATRKEPVLKEVGNKEAPLLKKELHIQKESTTAREVKKEVAKEGQGKKVGSGKKRKRGEITDFFSTI